MSLDYGFRVSLPGKNVLLCGDKDLVITSKAPCLKVVDVGEVGFQFSGGGASITVAHAIPLPFLVIGYYYSSAVEAWWAIDDISFDANNIYFNIYDTDNVINPILIYFILYA
jgi:hypothetical protein